MPTTTTPQVPAPVTGVAGGVPFLAVPPDGGQDATAPLVIAWHLLDPPRTEAAMRAALPLAGLHAWRVYLGLPLTGARLPEGGFEELARRAATDAVLELYRPVVHGAAEEFPGVFQALAGQLGLEPAAVGLLGGSAGAAVAQLVLAGGGVDVTAVVLASPLVQLQPAIDAMAAAFGSTYQWSGEAAAVAGQLDFVARAEALSGAPVRLVVGADDADHIRNPAAALRDALRARGAEADLHEVAGMGHALAAEPGTGPAPQTPHAAEVDRLAAEWFRRHLLT